MYQHDSLDIHSQAPFDRQHTWEFGFEGVLVDGICALLTADELKKVDSFLDDVTSFPGLKHVPKLKRYSSSETVRAFLCFSCRPENKLEFCFPPPPLPDEVSPQASSFCTRLLE